MGQPPPAFADDRLIARRFALVEHRLFDDLIGPQQHRRRDGEPEGLRGLHVDDQLELRRLLDWRSAGFAPLRILST